MTPLLVIAFGFHPPWRSAPTSSTARSSRRSARCGTARSAPCRPGSRAGCSWAAPRCHSSACGPAMDARPLRDGAQSAQARILGVARCCRARAARQTSCGPRPDKPFILTRRDRIAAVLIGLGGGFMVGLTSVGSGRLLRALVARPVPAAIVQVVGTDILHAAALLWVARAPTSWPATSTSDRARGCSSDRYRESSSGVASSVRLPDRVAAARTRRDAGRQWCEVARLPDSNETAISTLGRRTDRTRHLRPRAARAGAREHLTLPPRP